MWWKRRKSFLTGFTLMEILTALAILGGSAFVLLSIHYNAMRLHEEALSISDEYQLLTLACSRAEMGVLSGTLADSGEFGEKFEGYSWSYSATPVGSDPAVSLYAVNVTLNKPEGESKTVNFLCYGLSVQTQDNSLTGSVRGRSNAGTPSRK